MENNIRKFSARNLNIKRCTFKDVKCNNFAEYSLINDSGTVYLCAKHYLHYKKQGLVVEKKEIKYSPILLRNGYEKNGEVLFKSKSWIETRGKFTWENWSDFGRPVLFKKKLRYRKIPLEVVGSMIAEKLIWNNSEKCDFSWGGQSDLILAEFRGNYFVFWQSGRLIAQVTENFKPVKWFRK